ncbi:hypothetical protein NDU88_005971, partial [Pleurodeles waltl]
LKATEALLQQEKKVGHLNFAFQGVTAGPLLDQTPRSRLLLATTGLGQWAPESARPAAAIDDPIRASPCPRESPVKRCCCDRGSRGPEGVHFSPSLRPLLSSWCAEAAVAWDCHGTWPAGAVLGWAACSRVGFPARGRWGPRLPRTRPNPARGWRIAGWAPFAASRGGAK